MSGQNQHDVEDRSDSAYGADFYRWTLDQARLLRTGLVAEVDRLAVAEEIEDLGKSEYAALESDLTVILQHMLKWDHQPERRTRSWEISIREHRRRVTRRLIASPSLKNRLAEAVAEAFEDGRDRALAETGLPEQSVPTICGYALTDIMDRRFTLDRD
jgi:hypothetical protein